MKKISSLVLLLFLLVTVTTVTGQNNVLDVLVYDSYAVSEELVLRFEAANDVKLQFIEAGDGTELLNRAILTAEAPIADVIVGINSVLVNRALVNNLLESYESPYLSEIDAIYQTDPENRALPFNHGAVCINYDTEFFSTHELKVPTTLEELVDPVYSGMLAIENPISSTPGLAFMLMTIDVLGEDGYLFFWEDLLENGAEIVPDWSTAYYTNFTAGGGGGYQPMVVSYDASPAAVPFYAEEPMDEAPTASILADDMCIEMIEYAGILKGSDQVELAQKFIDALLSAEWQSDLPAQMFVYPVNGTATIPELFETFAPQPVNPVRMDPAIVAVNYEKWLQAWAESIRINQ